MDDIIKNFPNFDNIDIILEPYCGSFALIRYLISIYPNKIYICNVNDELLINTYKTIQDDEKCDELISLYIKKY